MEFDEKAQHIRPSSHPNIHAIKQFQKQIHAHETNVSKKMFLEHQFIKT